MVNAVERLPARRRGHDASGPHNISYGMIWLRGVGVVAGRYAPLPLRLILAIGFLAHGWPKVASGAAHAGFAQSLVDLGVPAAGFTAWLVGVVEVGGALLLLFGIVTGLACIVLGIEMVFAAFLVHAPHGFSFMQVAGQGPNGPVLGMPGVEVNLLYLAALCAVFLLGAGAFSFDEAWADHDARVARGERTM